MSSSSPTIRRGRLWIPLWALAGLLTACLHSADEEPPTRPNVVLIVIDALRADSLSSYGNARETSPSMDRLAERSFVFRNAVSVGGNTSTVMPAMMTGRYPYFRDDETWTRRTEFGLHRFYGTADESFGLPKALVTLAERFRQGGYETVGFVTNPYLKREFGMDRGFDEYFEIFRDERPVYGRAEDVTTAAIEWLDGDRRPFFLYLHYMDVHGPYQAPEDFRWRFDYPRVPDQDDLEVFDGWIQRRNTKGPDAQLVRDHLKGNYDTEIAYVDHWIGRLLKELEERGLVGETIVAITSDHGEEFLEHGGSTHAGTLYEEIVHVPLILAIPASAGGDTRKLVRNFDLGPTLLDYAGLEGFPSGVDARSLRPYFEGDDAAFDLSAFATFPYDAAKKGPGGVRMLRTERYKLLFRSAKPEFSELYDLEEDPGETRNLIETRPEIRTRLVAELRTLVSKLEGEASLGKAPEAAPESLDPRTEDQLRALGYLE